MRLVRKRDEQGAFYLHPTTEIGGKTLRYYKPQRGVVKMKVGQVLATSIKSK